MFYVDVYLFVHFVMEFILLRITQRLLGKKCNVVRTLLGALFTSTCNLLLLFVSFPVAVKYFMTYILVTFVEIKISFELHGRKDYIKAFVLLYALAFLAGGFLESIYERIPWVKQHGFSILTLLTAVFFLYLFMKKLVCMFKERAIQQCIQNAEIHINGKVISCQGLLDTGNHLFDPITGKPVMIVEKGELQKSGVKIRQEQYRVIPFHSLGNKNGMLEAFVADFVRVTEKEAEAGREEAKVIVGIYDGKLSNDGSYQMILHPLL